MITTELCFEYSDCSAKLLPLLRGKIFHVTCGKYLSAILEANQIQPNQSGALATAFGSSSNSFFRNRGCVSIFDYRTVDDVQLSDSIFKCSPWQAGRLCDYELAIFILNEAMSDRLESWSLWKSTASYSQMVVPHVEAGHPGPISLSCVDELWFVKLNYTPSALELALEASRQRAASD